MSVVVADRPSGLPVYDRGDWDHWTDVDGDCQDTRQEVLVAESSVPVTFTDDKSCRVATGRWRGPYTGEVAEDPGKLDVDHMVPLANAHLSGAHEWSAERKELYANSLSYPGHLIATTASANRSKGRKGPDEWRPPARTYWCRYAMDWAAIKREWGLTATVAEAAALREMLAGCEPRVHLQVLNADTSTPGTATPAPGTVPPTPVPEPTTPTATPEPAPFDVKYDPAGPDRDCGDFDTWADAQAFYTAAGGPETDRHRLDSDGDGVACRSLPGAPGPATPTAAPTPTLTPVPTSEPASPTPTPESPTPTPTATLTPTPAPTATWTPEPATPTPTPTPTLAPVTMPGPASPTPTPRPATPTPTPTATWTPEPATPTPTPTPEPTATPTPTPGTVDTKYDPAGPDRNCSDFDTWAEAQAFYEAAGGPGADRHRLDRDRNGVACESLSGAPSQSSSTPTPAAPTPRPRPTSALRATATPRPRPTATSVPATATPTATTTFTPTATPTSTPDASAVAVAATPAPASGTPTLTPTATHTPTPDAPTVTPTATQTPTPDTPTVTPTAIPTPAPAGPDRNCSDFDTWAEAQAFYEAEGGPESDRHRLDHDGDGIACESLPGAPKSATATPTPESKAPTPAPGSTNTVYDPDGPDRNCSDFDTWAEAQAFYEAAGGPETDRHRLDGDGNGVACESLPGAP